MLSNESYMNLVMMDVFPTVIEKFNSEKFSGEQLTALLAEEDKLELFECVIGEIGHLESIIVF